jgi:hypothetical protein
MKEFLKVDGYDKYILIDTEDIISYLSFDVESTTTPYAVHITRKSSGMEMIGFACRYDRNSFFRNISEICQPKQNHNYKWFSSMERANDQILLEIKKINKKIFNLSKKIENAKEKPKKKKGTHEN